MILVLNRPIEQKGFIKKSVVPKPACDVSPRLTCQCRCYLEKESRNMTESVLSESSSSYCRWGKEKKRKKKATDLLGSIDEKY